MSSEYFEAANQLRESGKLDEAIAYYRKAIEIYPTDYSIHHSLGDVLLQRRKSDLEEAIAAYRRVIDTNPENLQACENLLQIQPDSVDILSFLEKVFRRQGEHEKALYCCQRLIEIEPHSAEAQMNLGNMLLIKGKLEDGLRCHYKSNKIRLSTGNLNSKLPAILLNTLPKSGSVYILNSLANGLQIKTLRISSLFFPGARIILDQIEGLAGGMAIAQEHLCADLVNMNILSCYLDKILINVRDPRQAMISWVHHVEKLKNEMPSLLLRSPSLSLFCENYFSMSFTDKISWQIEKGYLPEAIKFIEGWCNASESKTFIPKILFTKQEDLASNPEFFFNSILDFMEIDKKNFIFPDPPKEGHLHYRKGKVDEWREIFTPEQAERASNIIPKQILERFGWLST